MFRHLLLERGAVDMPQPDGRQIERGLSIRKCADNTRADLAQDPLEWVVCPDTPSVFFREGVVRERFSEGRLLGQTHCAQLLDHYKAFARPAATSSQAWTHLGRTGLKASTI